MLPAGGGLLRGQLSDRRTARYYWSQNLSLGLTNEASLDQTRIARFVNAGIEACVSAAFHRRRERTSYPALVHLGVQRLFGFGVDDLAAADSLLADETEDDTARLAWRIFLRMVQAVERTRSFEGGSLEEVEHLVRTALMVGGRNSLVLAAATHANLKILGRPAEALVLARRALALSPSNPWPMMPLPCAARERRRGGGVRGRAARPLHRPGHPGGAVS